MRINDMLNVSDLDIRRELPGIIRDHVEEGAPFFTLVLSVDSALALANDIDVAVTCFPEGAPGIDG